MKHRETPEYLSGQYTVDLERFQRLLNGSSDLIFRKFTIDSEQDRQAAVIYLENLASKEQIQESIIHPLTSETAIKTIRGSKPEQLAVFLQTQLATPSHTRLTTVFNEAVSGLLVGETILIINGFDQAVIFSTPCRDERMISQPETEVTIRGPRESFVESIGTNTGLLRRRIGHPDLTVESSRVGGKTKTHISVVYLKGVVNEKIVQEVRLRLDRIQTDGIIGAGYIEQYLADAPLSLFSTLAYSERPDVVASKILEGRVAILIDGTPEVLTVPSLLIESFQNPDDYNSNPYYATLIRWIKYIAFGISILGPAVYIALSSYHQELIPTPLFINMAAGAEGTPFPVFFEVIIVGLLFEIFREAGIRLPKPAGMGITFVAALVLAQASVAMGLTGVATVVVVTITAIASLVIPNLTNIALMMRLLLAVLASIFGAYGILLGLLFTLIHAVSLRSFGVPFLSPIAPYNPRDFMHDVIFRIPVWAMGARPRTIGWHNPRRQSESNKPSPPPKDDKDDRR